MSSYKQGDIILVPFPFSDDLAQTKPRPALIVSNDELKNEVICVQITSNISRNEPTAVFVNVEDVSIPLPANSVIRCHLISTIATKIVIKKISSLSEDKLQRVLENIILLIN